MQGSLDGEGLSLHTGSPYAVLQFSAKVLPKRQNRSLQRFGSNGKIDAQGQIWTLSAKKEKQVTKVRVVWDHLQFRVAQKALFWSMWNHSQAVKAFPPAIFRDVLFPPSPNTPRSSFICEARQKSRGIVWLGNTPCCHQPRPTEPSLNSFSYVLAPKRMATSLAMVLIVLI